MRIEEHLPGASNGDQDHLNALIREIEPTVQRWVQRHSPLRGRVDGDDVAQECLIAIATGVGGLTHHSPSSFMRWADVIVRRRVVDYVSRRRSLSTCDGLTFVASPDPSPTAPLETEEDGARFLRVVGRLSSFQQQLLRDYFGNQRSCAEIAASVGRTRESITMAMRRTLARLRMELAPVS